ncbi:hypothetical protein Tco_0433420 [Tanacetum coccineum]
MKEMRDNTFAGNRDDDAHKHVQKVGCEICEGMHLYKEFLLRVEVKGVEEAKFGEFGRLFPNNGGNGAKYRVGQPGIHYLVKENLASKRPTINTWRSRPSTMPNATAKITGGAPNSSTYVSQCKVMQEIEEVKKVNKEPVPHDLPIVNHYVAPILTLRNALADLGASVSIKPFSMFKRLGLDMVGDFRMLLILGRPLLATTHMEIDVFRKHISLEVGNEKLLFKMEDNINETTIPIESVFVVKDVKNNNEDESFNILNIDDDLFSYDCISCININEFNYLLSIDEDIFMCEIDVYESEEEREYRWDMTLKARNPWDTESVDSVSSYKNEHRVISSQ